MRIEVQLERTCLLVTDAHKPISPVTSQVRKRKDCNPSDRASDPLITLGIPTRNRESLMKDCVASALAQSYQNIEVLVSDNASTDDTLAALGSIKYKRLRVVSKPEDIGMVRNFARCVQEARGDYLVLASDDNVPDPTLLETCVRLVRREPGIPIVLAPPCDIRERETNRPRRHQQEILNWDLGRDRNLERVSQRQILGAAPEQHHSHRHSTPQRLFHTSLRRRRRNTWIPARGPCRGLVNERCATYMLHGSSQSSAVSADSRFMDLCEVMDEISVLAESKIPDSTKRLQVQKLTWRYMVPPGDDHSRPLSPGRRELDRRRPEIKQLATNVAARHAARFRRDAPSPVSGAASYCRRARSMVDARMDRLV
jgi:hypothetical protein